ncbi:MAG: acyl-CoA dehydrogenase family protein [Zoogloeaceae bacterium]|nr:acyl-CoA dehydrogenase family protein [Zoogloeaceae bacterium]
MTSNTLTSLADTPEFQALNAEIRTRARSGEFDRIRHIPQDVVSRFVKLGVYRYLVPKAFGGMGGGPAEFCRMVETIAYHDGSAGWVASFGMNPMYLAALPLDTLHEIYRQNGPDIVFAGGIFPPQTAEVVPGGYRLNGRWKFSSGCMCATILGVGIIPQTGDANPLPRMALLPRAQVTEIDETWDTIGYLATGSHDLILKDVVVAPEYTFIRGGKPNLDEPFFKFYPSLSFATQVLSIVGAGVARAALDAFYEMTGSYKAVTGAPSIGERPLTLAEVGKLEAELRAARAFFYEAIEEAMTDVENGKRVSVYKTNNLRLSCTHIARVSAEVARGVQRLTGMAGIYRNHPIARMVNDTMVGTQHAFMGDITYQNAGSIFCGREPLPGYL